MAADIRLYTPFSSFSRIAENASSVIETSSILCEAVGIKRNKIKPFGTTG